MSTHKQATSERKIASTAYGKDRQENKHLSVFILLFFFLVDALKERNASDVKEPSEIAQEIIFEGIFLVVILQYAR